MLPLFSNFWVAEWQPLWKRAFFASVYHACISRTLVSLCRYFFSVFVLSAECGCIIVLLIYFFLFDGQPKWVPFAPEFQFCYFWEYSSLFYLSLFFGFCVPEIMHLWARNLPRKPNNLVSKEPRHNKGWGLVDRKLVEAPMNFYC